MHFPPSLFDVQYFLCTTPTLQVQHTSPSSVAQLVTRSEKALPRSPPLSQARLTFSSPPPPPKRRRGGDRHSAQEPPFFSGGGGGGRTRRRRRRPIRGKVEEARRRIPSSLACAAKTNQPRTRKKDRGERGRRRGQDGGEEGLSLSLPARRPSLP